MAMVMEQLRQSGGGQFVGEENQPSWKKSGVTLEEKYFRRVIAFERISPNLGDGCLT